MGGEGRGGGTLASLEFVAYRNALESHIKGGWRWFPDRNRYQAQVYIRLRPDGVVQQASIARTSGNSRFDDSVLRAVHKASPVPVPPPKLYSSFREIRITFDSHD